MSNGHMSTEGRSDKVGEKLDRRTELSLTISDQLSNIESRVSNLETICMVDFRIELQKIGDYTQGLQLKNIFLHLLLLYDRIMQESDVDENPKVRDFAKELYETLQASGISKIAREVGCDFDRKVHRIVAREQGSGAEPDKVLRIVRDGYMLNDFVIRYQEVVITAADDQEGSGVVSNVISTPASQSISSRSHEAGLIVRSQGAPDGLNVSPKHKSSDLSTSTSSEFIRSPTAHSSSLTDGVSSGQLTVMNMRPTGDEFVRANISKPGEVTRPVARVNHKETRTLMRSAHLDKRTGKITATWPQCRIFVEQSIDKIHSFGSRVWKLIHRQSR